MTRCKPREWYQRQERRALAAPRSCTECARSVCYGRRLQHCSRAARRRRSISRAHPMRAHIVRSRGQAAVHSRTPAVAARMPRAVQCWSLTCVLGPQQTAAVATAAACCCLIQSSQRCSEACRIRAVLSLLRLSAFEPVDRSWMVPRVSLRRGVLAMAGLRSVRWRAERATKQREKHGSEDCHKTSDLAPPRAGPSLSGPPGAGVLPATNQLMRGAERAEERAKLAL